MKVSFFRKKFPGEEVWGSGGEDAPIRGSGSLSTGGRRVTAERAVLQGSTARTVPVAR